MAAWIGISTRRTGSSLNFSPFVSEPSRSMVGAPSHAAWQQKELFNIPGLIVLDWPGNSPDLNQIEPCWYDMKRTVTKLSGVVSHKDTTVALWRQVWEELEQEKIGIWCSKMRPARYSACRFGLKFFS